MTIRIDYDYIAQHVPEGARVLDVGCGDGTLLEALVEGRHATVAGIDRDAAAVRTCIGKGLPVYHGDMLEGMALHAGGAFDCVVLSQTLQQVLEPHTVVDEMLRVGRRAFISFPNFAHWRVRMSYVLRGRMPVTRSLPYQWYDTPNVHFMTIRDFTVFCRDRNLRIVDRAFFSPSFRRLPAFAANALAGTAIFIIESNGDGG